MTTPTGPDDDRLRASTAGQKLCGHREAHSLDLVCTYPAGHPPIINPFADDSDWSEMLAGTYDHGDANRRSWWSVCNEAGCWCEESAHLRPAPQQPPAQERPEPGSEAWGEMIAANKAAGWHCGRGLAEGYCDNPDHARKGAHPPSEADSAGEDERLRILVFLSTLFGRGHAWEKPGQTRQDLTDANVELVREFVHSETTLAASSGVRGGDDQDDRARERLAADWLWSFMGGFGALADTSQEQQQRIRAHAVDFLRAAGGQR